MEKILAILIVMRRELQVLLKAVTQLNRTQIQKLSEEWVKKDEVLKSLGISKRTLSKLTSTGTLPYVKVNGLLYFKVSDIQKLMEENYIPSSTANDSNPKQKNNEQK